MATMLDAVINLKDNFSSTLTTVEKSVGNFSKTAKNMGRDVYRTGKNLKNFGDNMTKRVTLPILGAGAAAAKVSADYNKEMAKISTMIPGQTDRLYELKDAIQDVAVEVAKDTSEIAQGTYGVISAYGDAADTMEKVAINAKAATAGVATTEDALNLSSAVMKGFGDTSAKANEKVMDLAFETLRLGQTSFPEMASAIGAVVPLTNELKISQEELFATYAAATGVTGNASEVTTQYKGSLKALMAPTKEMRKLMDKLGYADGQAMIKKEGYVGAMKTIVDAAKSSNTPLQKYMGSIEGQTLALALAGELSEEYSGKLEQLKNSSGAMDRAFKEQTEGINKTGFTYEQAMVKMKVAAQGFGDAMAPMLSKGADLISRFADSIRNLTPEQKQAILRFAKMAAIIGPFISLVGRMTLGVSKGIFFFADFSRKVKKLGLTMKAIVGPGAIVSAVIAALVVGGILLYKNWDKVKESVSNVGKAISDFTGITGEHISAVIDVFKNLGKKVWEILKGVGESFRPLLSTIGTIIGQIIGIFKALMPVLMPILGFIVGVFVGKIIYSFLTLAHQVSAVISAVVGVINGLLQVLSGVIDFIVGVFTGDWERAWEGVKNIFDGLVGIIRSIWEGIIEFLTAPVSAVVDILDSAFHDKLDGVKKAWEELKEFFKNPIKGTINLAKKGAGWVADKIGRNYKGTSNWRGGPTWVHEKGAEIIDLPRGSRVYPHDKSLQMARQEGRNEAGNKSITIAKLADSIIVREDADIDRIASALVAKLEKTSFNMG